MSSLPKERRNSVTAWLSGGAPWQGQACDSIHPGARYSASPRQHRYHASDMTISVFPLPMLETRSLSNPRSSVTFPSSSPAPTETVSDTAAPDAAAACASREAYSLL